MYVYLGFEAILKRVFRLSYESTTVDTTSAGNGRISNQKQVSMKMLSSTVGVIWRIAWS